MALLINYLPNSDELQFIILYYNDFNMFNTIDLFSSVKCHFNEL